MQTITHICDVCKNSKGETELAHFEVRCTGGLQLIDRYTSFKIDVCKPCLEKKGFIIEKRQDQTTEEATTKNNKNLENKIIEILQELGVAFYE